MIPSNVVLIGLSGTGKTTVGRLLAARLDRPFVDTDELVEAEAGRSIADVFAAEGEAGFRVLEARAVERVAANGGQVVAVGGGAVMDADNLTRLRATGDVVWLDGDPVELAARVASGVPRPLLAGDPATRLRALDRARRPVYAAAADHVVTTTGRDPADVVALVEAWLRGPRRIRVAVPGGPYDVVVGPGVLDRLADELGPPPHARRTAVVTNGTVAALYAHPVTKGLEAVGLHSTLIAVPDSEEAKSLQTLEWLYHRFAAMPLGRDDLVVALGGGVVGDLAGFAAATWNRGVALAQAPTTLLAQVDAAVGGKTGINLPEGKNLVGAFHQPRVVLADTRCLATLPGRERRSGLGEVAKYGFIGDPVVLDLLESDPRAAQAGDAALLTEVVRRGVAVKARIVAADEREAGERALLNYGHTVGHAIETLAGYGAYRHGEAVALGMVFAARLGERLGISEPGLAARTVALLGALGLPVSGLRLDPVAVWEVLTRDKKARGGVRFVVCETPGRARIIEQPQRRLIDDVLESLA